MFSNKLNNFIFWIAVAVLISAAFHGLAAIKSIPWWVVYSDTFGFFDRAVANGFPYISKQIEYPVLIGFFIQLAGALGKNRIIYYLVTVVLLGAAAVLTTGLLHRLIPEGNKNRLWRYWIFAPSFLVFSMYNWDILAILFTVAALYFMQKERDYWSVFFIALGASAKFFPILFLLPLFLKRRKIGEWLKIGGIFGGTTLLLNGYFMAYHYDFWSYFFQLNTTRAPNPDSIWTIFRYFIWPFEISQINAISLILFSASLFYLLWTRRKESPAKLCFIAVLLFLLFNKVFSPQYILWLLPFFVILDLPAVGWFYALEFANLAALYSILPWFFSGHNMFYFYLATPFVLVRHFILLKILMFAIRKK